MSLLTQQEGPSTQAHEPIALLSRIVAEQIAAGEVIDRPASVVRELVDNGIDAGARRVDVSIEGGGRRLIRVVDDGRGMSPAQARLALERHATSKLRDLDDLLRIRTLGFRGEGLTSVALVSRLKIRSRPRDAGQGVEIEVEGGSVIDQRPVGCPVGTTVEVHDLFFNVPVRRKFLKSVATEAALVTEVVERQALAWAPVRFELSHEDRGIFSAPATADRGERVRALLRVSGASLASTRRVEEKVVLEVHLLEPSQSLSTTRGLRFIVNGRPIRDRTLLAALSRGTEVFYARGRYPRGVVYIDIDPGDVDINVHPQKSEVRFARPRQLFELLRATAHDLLAGRSGGHGRRVGEDAEEARPRPKVSSKARSRSEAPTESSARTYRLGGGGQTSAAEASPRGYVDQRTRIREATRRFWAEQPRQDNAEDFGLGAALAQSAEEASKNPAPSDGTPSAETQESVAARNVPGGGSRDATLVGRTREGILVVERQGAILLIEPIVAARHLLYRTLAQDLKAGPLPRADLSPPPVVGADVARAVAARSEALAILGFETETFGSGAWVLRSVPSALADLEVSSILGVLGEISEVISPGAASSSLSLESALRCLVARARVVVPDDAALLLGIDRLGAPLELRSSSSREGDLFSGVWRVRLGAFGRSRP
ncbi:MAG: DNA mismatch repair endonuclease MutL [Deltaproteobacteria bacterium]|nr:DNA mismatch repair endonuclease MutL [Deltaproteobacteria bacterium]